MTTKTAKAITFKFRATEDGSGEYWVPIRDNGKYDHVTRVKIGDLGYSPCTSGWIEPPDEPGWYDATVIGQMVFDLAEAGYEVRFVR